MGNFLTFLQRQKIKISCAFVRVLPFKIYFCGQGCAHFSLGLFSFSVDALLMVSPRSLPVRVRMHVGLEQYR